MPVVCSIVPTLILESIWIYLSAHNDVLGYQAMSSLPVYFYLAMMAAAAIITVLFFIFATNELTVVLEEDDDQSFNDDDDDDASIMPSADSPTVQQKPARMNKATKTSIRSIVIGTIFPTEVVKRTDLNHDHEANAIVECCPICIESFGEGDIIATSHCSHMFHHDCILKWSQIKSDACPVCRQAMWEQKTFDSIENEIITKQQIRESCAV